MRMGVCEYFPVSSIRTFDFLMFVRVSSRLTNRVFVMGGGEKSLSR